jgi:ADP-heptose:LPS heptosyltransferase
MTDTALVLRALKLGDLLVAIPAIRGLRRAYPAHRLVLATSGWLAPIVELIGGVDELLPVPGLDAPLPVDTADVAVNLHGSGARSRRLIDAVGARTTIAHHVDAVDGAGGTLPRWRDDLHERERWTRLVEAFGIPADPLDVGLHEPRHPAPVDRATVIHVGAAYGSRCWPVPRFAEVVRVLEREGHRVVLTGGESDRDRALAVAEAAGLAGSQVLAGRTTLGELAALIARARLIVSADTGAAHLASAYGRPSVVLFGPAPASEWGPPPGPHLVLTDESRRRGDVFAAEPDPALLAVDAADVLKAVVRLHV